MNEPTQEQIKEFWEWCGFKDVHTGEFSGDIIGFWEDELIHTPGPDNLEYLGFLFKYAIPNGCQQIIFQPDCYCGMTVNDVLYEATGKSEALSLFWAIWEVLNDKY